MGKDKEDSAEQTDSETQEPPKKEEIDEEKETEENEEKKEQDKKEETVEEQEEPEKKEKDVEKLRKVIKVDDSKEEDKKVNKKPSEDVDLSSREGLEQKRAMLQSIKDFDFQIKKNQEEITGINKKIESVSRDLDDLVSLYEIVSEQMNPFVGLSKVTKKRIDALENFTSEIDNLKDRMGEVESFAERTGANIKKETKKINADEEGSDKKEESELEEKEVDTPEDIDDNKKEIPAPQENNQISFSTRSSETSSYGDIDSIIEESLYALSQEMRIDRAIDDFIENLKTDNVN